MAVDTAPEASETVEPAASRSRRTTAATDAEVKQAIRMTADRILVRPSDELGERKSRAGILIPATANVNRRLIWAEVVTVGPTAEAKFINSAALCSRLIEPCFLLACARAAIRSSRSSRSVRRPESMAEN